MNIFFLIAVMLGAAALRVPVAYAMFASGFAYLFFSGQDVGLVAEQVMNTMYVNYVLIAVPMFMFAANVMNAGEISDRLFALCHAFVGRMRGGLAQVDVMVSVVFSTMSGSAVADAAGPGLVTIRMMSKAGYPPAFAAAIVAASATLGPMIPPSIPMILYALIANVSVAGLFLAGVVPGLMMALAMVITVWISSVKRNFPVDEAVPRDQFWRIIRRSLLSLFMPVLLLGGIYSGAFTATEAAAVAAAYALILAMGVYRAMSFGALVAVLVETARQTTVILLLIAGAFAINYGITAEQLDKQLAALVGGLNLTPLQFMLVVTVLFLLLGAVLENATLLLVLTPILIPSAAALGIDLVYFGTVMIFNITIALVMPPHGLLLFVLAALTKIPLGAIFRESLPFVAALVFTLFIMVFFPDLTMWLPRAAGYVK
jgi:C4-dicarboxylate transporter DctM subunit